MNRTSKIRRRLNSLRPGTLFTQLIRSATFFALITGGTIAKADSLWNKAVAKPMVSDRKAGRVGDILTILVQETSSTEKETSTSTSKDSGADIGITSFFYPPSASGLLTKKGTLPALKYNSSKTFDGGGQIENSEKINSRIAVRVIDVLPNKTLVIEGRRQTAFSDEKQDVILRGLVRSEDVQANNTVYSYNVADASIQFVSKGAISRPQKKGWFTRFWENVTPF